MSKYTEDDLKKELETKEYEYGFYTDIESDTLPVGLNEEIIIAISKKKEEPEWMTCLLYTSPSPRDDISSRMPSSA